MSVAGRARCHGTDATLERTVSGAYSTATGTVTKTTDESVVHGVIREFRQTELNDTIRASDRAFFVPCEEVDLPPSQDDALVFDTLRWRVVSVRTTMLRGEDQHYELQLRRHT